MAYHQVSVETAGVDSSKGLAFSRDGSRAVFVVSDAKGYNVTVINADGTGRHLVETVSAGWIGQLAISGDGSLVTYSGPTGELRIASADGTTVPPRDLVAATVNGTSPRFARDPANPQAWKVYFAVPKDIASPAMVRGVYSVNVDGTGVKALLSPTDVAPLANVTPDKPFPAVEGTLDVSSDGTRFVAAWSTGWCTQAGQQDFIIAATADGATKHLLKGPITTGCGVERLALSGDGTMIGSRIYDAGGTLQLGTMKFDASSPHDLGPILIERFGGWGLSDDGTSLLADNALWRTDGTSVFDVAVVGGFGSSDPLSVVGSYLGVLSGTGNRALYVVKGGPPYLAIVDFNPTTLGAAPGVTQPTISPSAISPGGPAATVSAKVASSMPPMRVASALLVNGRREANCIAGEQIMSEKVAGDGTFTNAGISATACVKLGPRTVRVRAEVQGMGGNHATVVDFTPFAVQ